MSDDKASLSAIRHVVVPGTFDPVTLGHLDVIRRARRLFPQVTVAVAASVGKRGEGPAFSIDERVEMLVESLAEQGVPADVAVRPFFGLLVDFCRGVGAGGVVKGLRAMTDFEYELQQAGLNAQLAPDLESVFVMSTPGFGYVSSSVVRELAALAGDVTSLVTPCVARRLAAHYATP